MTVCKRFDASTVNHSIPQYEIFFYINYNHVVSSIVANRPYLFPHQPTFHVRPFHSQSLYMDTGNRDVNVHRLAKTFRPEISSATRPLCLLYVCFLIACPTRSVYACNYHYYPRATVSALLWWREKERLIFPRAFDRPARYVRPLAPTISSARIHTPLYGSFFQAFWYAT